MPDLTRFTLNLPAHRGDNYPVTYLFAYTPTNGRNEEQAIRAAVAAYLARPADPDATTDDAEDRPETIGEALAEMDEVSHAEGDPDTVFTPFGLTILPNDTPLFVVTIYYDEKGE